MAAGVGIVRWESMVERKDWTLLAMQNQGKKDSRREARSAEFVTADLGYEYAGEMMDGRRS